MSRKRIDIPVPTAPFTVPDLKEQYPKYSPAVFQRHLEEWLAKGLIRRAGTIRAPGNRKPFYIYEPVHGDHLKNRDTASPPR